ncbi:MAG: hypothetical protein ACT4OM_11755 [Actinomycetota bacterium]
MLRFPVWMVLLVALAACGEGPEPVTTVAPVGDEQIQVFFSAGGDDCSKVVAVQRPSGAEPTLFGAMQELLAGPTEQEQTRGIDSLFGDRTKDLLISAEIDAGVAEVDFKDLRPAIPNASSSCGSASLLAQLDATTRQFGVEATRYSINGSLQTFYEWLQMTVPDA